MTARAPRWLAAGLHLWLGLSGCGSSPSPTENAPRPPVATAFATCEAACAQHCMTTSARADCEAVQVRCGCAPGMRRPPATLPAPAEVAPDLTEAAPAPDPAPSTSSAVSLPDCFGPSVPIRTWRGTPYVDVRIGGATGAFLVDYGTTFSTIDPSALTPAPLHDGRCWPDGEWFGPWPCPPLRPSSYGVATPFPQAGILGTDVLSSHVHTLDFEGGALHRAPPSTFCGEDELIASGFRSLEVVGWGAARRPGGVLVPAITVELAGVRVPAQLDTGYADWPVSHAINVNRAFLELTTRASALLVRAPERDLTLTTCVAGVTEPVQAYRLDDALFFVATTGTPVRSFHGVTVFVRDAPVAARACGGVGTWTEPGGQLGASFLSGARLVFDPVSGRVWIDGA